MDIIDNLKNRDMDYEYKITSKLFYLDVKICKWVERQKRRTNQPIRTITDIW